MTNVADTAPAPGTSQRSVLTRLRRLLAQTEIDLRLFGMLVALAVIIAGFNVQAGGDLFQPNNMATLAIQATSVAIIATGMVLIIVSRNIDLSVGSLTGFIAMSYALLMTDWMPNLLGMGPDFPFRWLIALRHRDRDRRRLRRDPGLHHRLHRRAVVRGDAGRSALHPRAPSGTSPTERGCSGLIRPSNSSTVEPRARSAGSSPGLVGIVGCVAVIALLANGRRQRRRFGFPLRPIWAEVALGVLGCAAIMFLAFFANGNYWPAGLAHQYAIDHNITEPAGGLKISAGFPLPIMLLVA